MKMLRRLAWLGFALGITSTIAFATNDSSTAAAARVQQLRAEIARHDELYFRQAAPVITDAEYDALKRELREIEQRHPELANTEPSAPGDDRSGRLPTQRHRVPMLGLEKSYTEAELRKFLAQVERQAGADAVTWTVEPKYDGLAISLTYERGRLVHAVTRGNGTEGDVVTDALLALTDVPRELPGPAVPEVLELRGEVFMAQAEFDRISAERIAAGLDVYAHPRNLAVGTLKAIDGTDARSRRLMVVIFGWGAWSPAEHAPATQRELYRTVGAWGFAAPEAHVVHGSNTVWGVVRAMELGRQDFPAPLDGVVVKIDEVALRNQLGESRTAPNWAIAHKFEPERVETRLRAITLQVGRTGTITPVAELEPVAIGGTKISRASLHNRREIERRDYRVGDLVRVERAGDVIPQLVGVNLAARPVGSAPFIFPAECPACARALVPDGEAGVRCPHRACPAQVKRRVEHFVSNAALNIRGFGPALAAELVDRGAVRDIDDLYRLGDEWPERVREQLRASKTAEWWRWIAGLGLPEVGGVSARRLGARFPTFEELLRADESALRSAGLHESAARAVAAELRQEGTQRLLKSLASLDLQPVRDAAAGALAGKSFVFTGSLSGTTRAEAERLVRDAGGRVQSNVTRGTDYVVAGEGGGRKLDEARRLNLRVLSEAEFLALVAPK